MATERRACGYREESLWQQGGLGKWECPKDWDQQQTYVNRPVVCVSWLEAAAYAQWAGCRLPTEAQWERAARGPEGHPYPWGDAKPDTSLLNYRESKVHCATPVGIYPAGATPDGILDMAGNVWEWCGDWYEEYTETRPTSGNPKGPTSGSSRVLQGGAWNSDPWRCRGAFRRHDDPGVRLGVIGFRLVSFCRGLPQ